MLDDLRTVSSEGPDFRKGYHDSGTVRSNGVTGWRINHKRDRQKAGNHGGECEQQASRPCPQSSDCGAGAGGDPRGSPAAPANRLVGDGYRPASQAWEMSFFCGPGKGRCTAELRKEIQWPSIAHVRQLRCWAFGPGCFLTLFGMSAWTLHRKDRAAAINGTLRISAEHRGGCFVVIWLRSQKGR